MEQDAELELCNEFEAWCKENELKASDHDELLRTEGLTDDQYCWLTTFSLRWNEMISQYSFA